MSPVYINGVEQVAIHAPRHQDTGADEITVAALSGLLADDQHVLDAEALAAAEAGAVSAATANKIAKRDASARAKFAAPAAAGDALIKGTALTITEMAALTTGKIWQGVANRPSEVAMPAGGATIVRKTADEIVNNSEVLQNDDHLLFAMAANEVWHVKLVILAVSVSVTPDIKSNVSLPALATQNWIKHDAAGVDVDEGFSMTMQVKQAVTLCAFIEYIIVNGANAGNFQWQWAQNVATAENTTVKANSCIIAHKIA